MAVKKTETKICIYKLKKNVCIKLFRCFTDAGLQKIQYQFQRLAWPSGGMFNAEVFSVSILGRVFNKGSVFTSGACVFIPGSVLSPGKCFSILGSV